MKLESIAAAQLYGASRQVAPAVEEGEGKGFADALESALGEMRASLQRGERAATDAMTGTGDVQSVVEALTATELALETAVTVRDRVVEAYQEILRMPV
jgi:flagellar hook-basal body complex protein FliE